MTEKKNTNTKKPILKKVSGSSDTKRSETKTVKPVKSTETKKILTIKDDKKPVAIKKIVKDKSTIKPIKKAVNKHMKNIKKDEVKVEVKKVSNEQVKMVKKDATGKVVDKFGRAYATGRRKNAIAKVWVKKGTGKVTINNRSAKDYLKRDMLIITINAPFVATQTEGKYDVVCQVLGGGISGQADAIKLGISKALLLFNSEAYRADLKKGKFLKRDPRIVERKKAGLKKARKAPQFSKR